jgi:hypothetical protein
VVWSLGFITGLKAEAKDLEFHGFVIPGAGYPHVVTLEFGFERAYGRKMRV